MAKTKDFDFIIYDKDLKKDLEKYCLKHYAGNAKIKLNCSVPFMVWIPMKAPNPSAIQDDRVLKMKIKKVTDSAYQKHLGEIAKMIKNYGDSQDQNALDAIWSSIQGENEKLGNQFGRDAQVVLKKYLAQRADAKLASFKFKYNRYKTGLSLVGAVAGTSVAIAGAATASVATFGASIAAVGLAVAGGAKVIRSAYGEYKRQTKSIQDTRDSINETIKVLNKSIGAHPGGKKAKVSAKEVGAKMLSEWAGVNIRSIKKLEQDTKLLKTKANIMVLQSSKDGAIAGKFHTQAKLITADLKKLQQSVADLKKQLPKDPAVAKKIAEVEKDMKKLEGNVKFLKDARDYVTSEAQKSRKTFRTMIKVEIEGPNGLENTAKDFKKARHDIGWTAVPIKLLPTLLSLGVSGGAAANPLDNAAEQLEAMAGLAQSAGESATELAQLVDGKLKIAKRAAKAARG